MRVVTAALLTLLVLVQAELWFGRGGVPRSLDLSAQLRDQKAKNTTARERNAQASAELSDLKDGLEIVEEKARAELGMVKQDEILVQVAPAR
jgi:cell division protein FtsB